MNDQPKISPSVPDSKLTSIPSSIIVLTREHIGDLVCTTPALRSLRKCYPDAHIAVEVGERAVCVLKDNPNIDEIIVRPDHQGLSGKWRFIRLLRQRGFSLAIILDDSVDMFLYVWLGGVPRRVGLVRKKRFSRLLTDRIPYDAEAHQMVDNFRNVVAFLGADVSDAAPEIFSTSADAETADRLLREAGVKVGETLVAINPGASLQCRCWPTDRFAELGNILSTRPGLQLLLLGGPGDQDRAKAIRAGMQTAPITLTGTTVLQQAELQRRCAVLVTADTGPMHLACATKTPIVALFGPTDPKEFGPGYVPGNTTIRKVSGCPQCTWEVCTQQNACMHLISAEEVAEAVYAVLSLPANFHSESKTDNLCR